MGYALRIVWNKEDGTPYKVIELNCTRIETQVRSAPYVYNKPTKMNGVTPPETKIKPRRKQLTFKIRAHGYCSKQEKEDLLNLAQLKASFEVYKYDAPGTEDTSVSLLRYENGGSKVFRKYYITALQFTEDSAVEPGKIRFIVEMDRRYD